MLWYSEERETSGDRPELADKKANLPTKLYYAPNYVRQALDIWWIFRHNLTLPQETYSLALVYCSFHEVKRWEDTSSAPALTFFDAWDGIEFVLKTCLQLHHQMTAKKTEYRRIAIQCLTMGSDHLRGLNCATDEFVLNILFKSFLEAKYIDNVSFMTW